MHSRACMGFAFSTVICNPVIFLKHLDSRVLPFEEWHPLSRIIVLPLSNNHITTFDYSHHPSNNVEDAGHPAPSVCLFSHATKDN